MLVLGCVYYQHDLRMLLAAACICIFACITARAMVLRGAASQDMKTRITWLLGAGMVSGAGVWATHFVAMLAYEISLPIRFDMGLTILSVVMAMIISAAGFALSFSRAGGAVGGMVVGIAVLTMHYTGMAALRLPAEAIWNEQLIAASILIGVSVGGLAGHFAALPSNRWNNVDSWRIGLPSPRQAVHEGRGTRATLLLRIGVGRCVRTADSLVLVEGPPAFARR